MSLSFNRFKWIQGREKVIVMQSFFIRTRSTNDHSHSNHFLATGMTRDHCHSIDLYGYKVDLMPLSFSNFLWPYLYGYKVN